MLIKSLSKEQKEVVYAIEDGSSIFVTGSAGTGKSHLLKYLKKIIFLLILQSPPALALLLLILVGKPFTLGQALGLAI